MNPEIIALIALIGAGVIYVILPKRTNVLDPDSVDASSWVERREQPQEEPSFPPKTQRFIPTPVYTIQEGDNEDEQDGGSRRQTKKRPTKKRPTKRRQTKRRQTKRRHAKRRQTKKRHTKNKTNS